MNMLLIWLLVAYGTLKFGSMALAAAPGFRRVEISFWSRLRAREPWLLLAAMLIAVPPVMVERWYAHRTLDRQYEAAITCYGQMMALRHIHAFKDDLSGFAAFEAVQQSKTWAVKLGADLNMRPEDVRRAQTAEQQFFAARYRTMQRRGMRRALLDEMGLAQQCLLPPDAARSPVR